MSSGYSYDAMAPRNCNFSTCPFSVAPDPLLLEIVAVRRSLQDAVPQTPGSKAAQLYSRLERGLAHSRTLTTAAYTRPACRGAWCFRERKIPIIIRRYLPDHREDHPSFEDWSIDELIVDRM